MTPCTVVSLRPRLRMVSIMPGMEARAPERTEISSGSAASPNFLPVPPGFTITTEVCNHFSAHGDYPEGVDEQVAAALAALEADTGKKFGDALGVIAVGRE